MSAPRRIQLRRTKGWRKPEGTVVVSRPSKWGNPYALSLYRADYAEHDETDLRFMATSDFKGLLEGKWCELEDMPLYPTLPEIRDALAGRDLACWCPLDQPCHADVLLELANGGVA